MNNKIKGVHGLSKWKYKDYEYLEYNNRILCMQYLLNKSNKKSANLFIFCKFCGNEDLFADSSRFKKYGEYLGCKCESKKKMDFILDKKSSRFHYLFMDEDEYNRIHSIPNGKEKVRMIERILALNNLYSQSYKGEDIQNG